MKEIIIYGLGDFAKLMRYHFEKESDVKVIAFSADKKFCREEYFDGLPLFPLENLELYYAKDEHYIFLAVGYSNMRARTVMYNKMVEKGFKSTNYISKHACVDPSVVLGRNNIVFQGTQIEPFCKIGDNNIIWSSAVISHDVVISDHNFLSSQTLVGGFSKIGDRCFFGFNCAVSSSIVVADETLLAAKSFLNRNSLPASRYQGVPASCVSSHIDDGILIK